MTKADWADSFDPGAFRPLREVVLRRIRRAMQTGISLAYAAEVDVLEQVDRLLVRFNVEMWGEVVEEKKVRVPVKVETPASPWEFFKLVYMPTWFKRRWPVKMWERDETAEYLLSVKAVYPSFRPAVRGEEYRVIASLTDGAEQAAWVTGPLYSKVVGPEDARRRIFDLEMRLEAAQGQLRGAAHRETKMQKEIDQLVAVGANLYLEGLAAGEKKGAEDGKA